MASCELPGLHGQQHGEIHLGTMLYELKMYFFTPAYFSKGKVKNKKNLANELNLGCCNGKKFLKKKKKSPDLPYSILVNIHLAKNM